MVSNETLSKIAAILCTIAESVPTDDPVPASTIYLALGMDMMEYTRLVNLMTSNSLIRATPSTLRLTLKGKQIADSILVEMELTDHGNHGQEQGVHPEKLVE